MATMQSEKGETLIVKTAAGSGPCASQDLEFWVGGQKMEGVLSVKLGEAKGDGTLRPDNFVSVTLECLARIG